MVLNQDYVIQKMMTMHSLSSLQATRVYWYIVEGYDTRRALIMGRSF